MESVLNVVSQLNNSKYFGGLVMLLLNMSSKYVSLELSEAQQQFLSQPLIRKMLVFTIFFISTKDIIISLVLSIVFVVVVCGLFHEDSNICLAKDSMKRFCKMRKKQVSKEDYDSAIKVILDYNKQENKNKN